MNTLIIEFLAILSGVLMILVSCSSVLEIRDKDRWVLIILSCIVFLIGIIMVMGTVTLGWKL